MAVNKLKAKDFCHFFKCVYGDVQPKEFGPFQHRLDLYCVESCPETTSQLFSRRLARGIKNTFFSAGLEPDASEINLDQRF